MARTQGSGAPNKIPVFQADALTSQANPVSTTLYDVLAATPNVRLLGISAQVTWATTQPTPLEAVVTIDGQTIIFGKSNPVTATPYYACMDSGYTNALQALAPTVYDFYRGFLIEGRSVRVQVRVTWAVTQPTPLVCRVKYAKIP